MYFGFQQVGLQAQFEFNNKRRIITVEDADSGPNGHASTEYVTTQHRIAENLTYWTGQKKASQPEMDDFNQKILKNQDAVLKATTKIILKYEDHVFKLK